MGDLFGACVISQSLADWVRGKAAALAPVAGRSAAFAAQAPVRCLDETGFRVAGQGQWLHTVATETLTHYRVSAKRGEMPEGLTGEVAVHDGFKSYSGLTDVRHALCNAHHLRELKALVEIDREPWAAPMRDLMLEANRAVENAREAGATSLPPPALEGFFTRYWEILRQGLAFHRNLPRLQRHPSNRGRTKHRPGHNLLIRLHEFKDDVLRFLVDFSVPFTNNLAEQALRMMKVQMVLAVIFHLRSRRRLRWEGPRHRTVGARSAAFPAILRAIEKDLLSRAERRSLKSRWRAARRAEALATLLDVRQRIRALAQEPAG